MGFPSTPKPQLLWAGFSVLVCFVFSLTWNWEVHLGGSSHRSKGILADWNGNKNGNERGWEENSEDNFLPPSHLLPSWGQPHRGLIGTPRSLASIPLFSSRVFPEEEGTESLVFPLLGRRPSLLEKLRYGILEGKYTIETDDKGRIWSIRLNPDLSEDQGVLLPDRDLFLHEFRELFAQDLGTQVQFRWAKQDGEKKFIEMKIWTH